MWIDRRLAIALGAASLLLNIFLVGLVVGENVRRPHRGPLVIGGGGPIVRQRQVRFLQPDERRRFAMTMAPHRAAIRAARDAVRQHRRAVETLLVADRYDRDVVAASFVALRAAEAAAAAALDEGLVVAMAALPAPARRALVAAQLPARGDGVADSTQSGGSAPPGIAPDAVPHAASPMLPAPGKGPAVR